MADLLWETEPTVDRPILILAFEGLFDAAQAATSAVQHLKRAGTVNRIGSIDPEEFFDFTQQRPVVSFDGDGNRKITWPQNEFFEIATPDESPDIVMLAGIEPQLRWRTFAAAITEAATRMQSSLVVTLGAMVGLAPHTRTLGVVGSATDPDLATRLGLGRPSYEGPTGLVGAVHHSLNEADIPIISLRVSVPHYVPGPPNPEATRSLLARLELVTGIRTDHKSLETGAHEWRQRVEKAVANDPEMAEYVKSLEAQVDDAADELLPSGDDLAAELQAFLRDRDG